MRKKNCFRLVILFLLGSATAEFTDSFAAQPAPAARFEQDRFAIGAFWAIFPDDADLDARFGEIADANFTLVFGPIRGCSPQRLVELCGRHGMAAIVYAHSGSVADLPAGDACWGYRLFDEPSSTIFPQLRERVAAIRQARPDKLAYINLYPNYANSKQLGVATYEEHVARFVSQVQPDVLCMDHYPIFKPAGDSRDRYCRNLETMRVHSVKAGIPFWNYFNTAPFGPHTDPTEDQIRWQVYTSIAYGAKGVAYFTYGTPDTFEFPKGSAILQRDGSRTRHWYQARRINARIKKLGPTLMQLRSTGVYRVKPGDDPADALRATPIRTISHAEVDPPNDYLVGVFRHADGRRAVMLNNYRFAYTAWPTVEFNAASDQVLEIDQRSGQEIPLRDDSPKMPGLQISLDAGEGRLFLLAE